VSDWSVQHTARIPDQLVHSPARAIGMTFDPAQPRKLILWSSAFVYRVDLDKVASRKLEWLEDDNTTEGSNGHQAKKARRDNDDEGVDGAEGDVDNAMKSKKIKKKKEKKIKKINNKKKLKSSGANGITISKDYGPIVFLDYTGPGQALVLEANWLKVMSHFPDVLQRQRYGTN
jgi:U3 small nucleolar RNA-associated protein 4